MDEHGDALLHGLNADALNAIWAMVTGSSKIAK
jgi:hypothetical protein